MAGRVVPIILVTAIGITIGVRTFDREFKAQRLKKLEEEHQRDAAAAAQSTSKAPPEVPVSLAKPKEPELLKQQVRNSTSSSASSSFSFFGYWPGGSKATSPPTASKDARGAETTQQGGSGHQR
ncbi:hypothetical protein EJ04DRAFT_507479 [Polyplosphaeria fusca]|uniref:Uncharacterized protein n=1 Tax=Polyplosphaeria fusca TaxID=682080 RepID=A0A9P4R8M8_9PLEO|nr:hypothetical protein EJ04DRAFT_507479 [Polyplosphaeria fusca]